MAVSAGGAPVDELDARILALFERGLNPPNFAFQTAAEQFKLIDEDTVAVLIPYNETAEDLLAQLAATNYPFSVARKLQPLVGL